MIVDFHTHVFPPEVASDRSRYVSLDATFAELYSNLEAKLASADELLSSMDAAGIDVSVALGFAWSDAGTCRLHNDYLIEAANRSDLGRRSDVRQRSRGSPASASHGTSSGNRRILAFPNLPLAAGAEAIEREARRCVAAGARGFGELRPDNLGFDLAGEGGDCLARVAAELGALLLFHVTEPAGHAYPGKQGLALGSFWSFVTAHPELKVVGAHWGGGLPFYASMPEVKQALTTTYVDTAASSLLYDDTVYRRVVDLAGAEAVLFGSDYPLLSQARSKRRIEESGLDADARDLVLGANAARLLGLA